MADVPLNILHYSSRSKKAIQAFYPFQLVYISPLMQITVINYAPTAKPPLRGGFQLQHRSKGGVTGLRREEKALPHPEGIVQLWREELTAGFY